MRAKFHVTAVTPFKSPAGELQSEKITFAAVAGKFDQEGTSEDNTYAKWTPSADLNIQITNPALFGAHAVGDVFYVDFTKVDPAAEQATP